MDLPKTAMPDLNTPGMRTDEKLQLLNEWMYTLEKNIRFVLNNLETDNLGTELADRIKAISEGNSGEETGAVKGGGVDSVNGVWPDEEGNVMLTAENVGALPASDAAADAAKLGGKTWAERLLDIYPVGSIYMSVSSTSPASMFGGTWEQLKDRFLLGAGDTYANGATGGSATHTLSVDEMPAHSHTTLINIAETMGKVDGGYTYAISNSGSFPTGTSGGNKPHNNLPPYLAVYMWKRVS